MVLLTSIRWTRKFNYLLNNTPFSVRTRSFISSFEGKVQSPKEPLPADKKKKKKKKKNEKNTERMETEQEEGMKEKKDNAYYSSIPITSTTVQDHPEGIRQILKKILPDHKLLHHLDQHKLGYLTTRRSRRRVAQNFDLLDGQTREGTYSIVYDRSKAPFPFDKIGKTLFSSREMDFSEMMVESNPPQIALIGRSNVGKSTLINALVGYNKSYIQKAIVSDRPGETKEITFYQLGNVFNPHYFHPTQLQKSFSRSIPQTDSSKRNNSGSGGQNSVAAPAATDAAASVGVSKEEESLYRHLTHLPGLIIVDMPGYGFAFMNEEDKKRAHQLYVEYLFDSQFLANCPIKRVLLLVDARHGLKKTDMDFLELLNVTYQEYRKKYRPLTSNKKEKEEANELELLKKQPDYVPSILKDTYPKNLSWKLQFVVTKCDLVERIELCKRIQHLKTQINHHVPSFFFNDLPPIALSGKDFSGLVVLQKELAGLITNPVVKEFKLKLLKQQEEREKYQQLHRKDGGKEGKAGRRRKGARDDRRKDGARKDFGDKGTRSRSFEKGRDRDDPKGRTRSTERGSSRDDRKTSLRSFERGGDQNDDRKPRNRSSERKAEFGERRQYKDEDGYRGRPQQHKQRRVGRESEERSGERKFKQYSGSGSEDEEEQVEIRYKKRMEGKNSEGREGNIVSKRGKQLITLEESQQKRKSNKNRGEAEVSGRRRIRSSIFKKSADKPSE